MRIDSEVKIECENIPINAKFKGYKPYLVQDMKVSVTTTRYLLAQWQTKDGRYITAKLPAELEGSHFGPGIKEHIVAQHHGNGVTQNKIYQELCEFGIDISVGQIDNILSAAVEEFLPEKEGILEAGKLCSKNLNSDDTSSRHLGKNGFCNVICNELFAYFKTTNSKSRVNFLQVLRGKNTDYIINEVAYQYCLSCGFHTKLLVHVRNNMDKTFCTDGDWQAFLASYAMTSTQQRILTEAALMGSLIHHGLSPNIVLVTDDAKQFDIPNVTHGLCWAHAIRNIIKVVVADDKTQEELDSLIDEIKDYFKDLKEYAINPSLPTKEALWKQFDTFTTKDFVNPALKKALQYFINNKKELLCVLDHPDVPLTNNVAERAIRKPVTRRKISGGTRSTLGREGRDTFTSLKVTASLHDIHFRAYLRDRLNKENKIPWLPDLIIKKAQSIRAPS